MSRIARPACVIRTMPALAIDVLRPAVHIGSIARIAPGGCRMPKTQVLAETSQPPHLLCVRYSQVSVHDNDLAAGEAS